MRFKLECAVTPQYAPHLDDESWHGETRTAAKPNHLNDLFDAYVEELEAEGYISVVRQPHGRQCRLVTLYDYELCNTPAFVFTLSAS